MLLGQIINTPCARIMSLLMSSLKFSYLSILTLAQASVATGFGFQNPIQLKILATRFLPPANSFLFVLAHGVWAGVYD